MVYNLVINVVQKADTFFIWCRGLTAYQLREIIDERSPDFIKGIKDRGLKLKFENPSTTRPCSKTR